MPTEVVCPSCGRKGRVAEAYANRLVRCYQCHKPYLASPQSGEPAAGPDGGPEVRPPDGAAAQPPEPRPDGLPAPAAARRPRKRLPAWVLLVGCLAVALLVAYHIAPTGREGAREGQQPTLGIPDVGPGRGWRGRGGRPPGMRRPPGAAPGGPGLV